MERSLRKQAVGGGYRGRWIIKEDGLWKNQQEEKAIDICFGESHGKEGKTGCQSPENVGQVDLGFLTPRVLVYRVLTPKLRPKASGELL
jgi:hypothetical protein